MPQTIRELWNGNIAPCEHCGDHDLRVNQLIGYIDCSEEYLLYMLELAFCDGFCLGGKLTAEVLT